MSSRGMPHLFALPRELRDLVYYYYVRDDDGYHFHFETRKLRRSNGQFINLSLMYTCSRIANEMHGLALKSNTIVFRTIDCEAERLRAGMFNWQVDELNSAKAILRDGLVEDELASYLTPEIRNRLVEMHPECDAYFSLRTKDWRESGIDREWYFEDRFGLGYSQLREFTDDLIKSLAMPYVEAYGRSEDHRFRESFYTYPSKRSKFLHSSLPFWKPTLWEIPSNDTIDYLRQAFDPRLDSEGKDRGRHWELFKWNYSAVTAAIGFLKSLSKRTRLSLRALSLLEDHSSILHPECHGAGLIPFCQENRKLRIERRISLWKNAMSSPYVHWRSNQFFSRRGSVSELFGATPPLKSGEVVPYIVPWITETLRLPTLGMPQDSFTLIFDDDTLTELSIQIWDLLKQNIAWYVAWDEAVSKGLVAKSFDYIFLDVIVGRRTISEIGNMAEGVSRISCNFPIGGELYEPPNMFTRRSSFEHCVRWCIERDHFMRPESIDTSPYLPSNWRDTRVNPNDPLPPTTQPASYERNGYEFPG